MAENIGKRAQQEREKRLRESDEAVRAKVNSLSYIANEIEENFSIIKHLIKENKRNKKVLSHHVSIEEYKSKMQQGITRLQNSIMELSALDASKCSIVSPHYQQQIANWQKQLKELEPQIKNVILTGDDDLDEFDKLENESFLDRILGNDNESKSTSEQAKKEARIINSIVFTNNADELTQTLLNFGNLIDTEISYFDFAGTEHKFSDARTKFDNGVRLLKSIDPNNKMISYFESQQQKWEKKRKMHIKYRIYIIAGIVFFILLFTILSKLGIIE